MLHINYKLADALQKKNKTYLKVGKTISAVLQLANLTQILQLHLLLQAASLFIYLFLWPYEK